MERIAPALLGRLVIPLLLPGFRKRQSISVGMRRALAVLLVGTVLLFGALLAQSIYRSIAQRPVFDIQGFWLYGRVAASGYRFRIIRTQGDRCARFASNSLVRAATAAIRSLAQDVDCVYTQSEQILSRMTARPLA